MLLDTLVRRFDVLPDTGWTQDILAIEAEAATQPEPAPLDVRRLKGAVHRARFEGVCSESCRSWDIEDAALAERIAAAYRQQPDSDR